MRVLLSLAVALVTAVAFAGAAFADAAPVQLVLVWTPNVSNTAPKTATGIAELVLSEGEVRVKTADLPRLDGDKQYVAWLVNSKTNDFYKLGAFNTSASGGAVDYETVEPDSIPDKDWNLLLLTVEDSADASQPGKTHSIAGAFPNSTDNTLPEILPNTGGAPDAPISQNLMADLGNHASVLSQAEWTALSVLAALMLGVTFGAGFALGLKRR